MRTADDIINLTGNNTMNCCLSESVVTRRHLDNEVVDNIGIAYHTARTWIGVTINLAYSIGNVVIGNGMLVMASLSKKVSLASPIDAFATHNPAPFSATPPPQAMPPAWHPSQWSGCNESLLIPA
jgi:hypothetical protein